jgi:hypothetical protein
LWVFYELINGSIAYHYDSDGAGNLNDNIYSKSTYLKFEKIRD